MQQIEVIIMGQSYLLGCPEGGEAKLRQAVSKVDKEMTTIRDSGRLKARERIAVLAALNIAFEHLMQPSKPVSELAESNESPSGPGRSADEDMQVDRLIQRLDAALGTDGQLL